jgi:PAS domain S-box-containing protein
LVLTYANQRALELFGYAPGEISTLNGLELIAPEDRRRAQENMARRFGGDDPGPVEYRAMRKDGTVFSVLFHAGSVMDEGRLMGLRGIIIDLSAQKEAEAEKERIEDQYRQSQKVEALGRLAGGVAHDLNNLLTPIIGYAEMLMEDFSPKDDRKEFADQIVQAGYGARNMVRQLLAFGRKQTLENKLLNLNKVIADFKKLLRRTIREDIELDIILSPDIGSIKADIGQLEQVIMNLCVNAQDAMLQSGRLTLETAMVHLDELYVAHHAGTRQGRYVMLAVSDTGCGIDQVTRDHIFEPFFSTKGDQGTGLGLATVYGIVKQHGGNIWVYSEPQGGTVFKVYLPVAGEADKDLIPTEKKIDRLEGSETVLLVEDNDQVRRLAEAILTRRGYTLISAANGAQALAALSTHDNMVDLLLTDVVMPDMNGKELYERTLQQCPDIKVLYMSGYSGNVIAHRGILDAGVRFIQKPFTVQGLAAKVREVMQDH